MKHLPLASLAILVAWALPAAADPVTLTDTNINLEAHDSFSTGNLFDVATGSHTVSIDTASSSLDYSYHSDANGAQLDLDFDQSFDVDSGAGSYGSAYGTVQFTLSTATSYTLSGSYTTLASSNDQLYTDTRLYDGTGTIFRDVEFTDGVTPGETLTVDGAAQGGVFNIQSGSTSGVLAAGSYTFYFQRWIYDSTNAADGAGQAAGSLTLTLGDPQLNAVPEPGTWALLALGGLALLSGARRKR